jgi:hypothetical protein
MTIDELLATQTAIPPSNYSPHLWDAMLLAACALGGWGGIILTELDWGSLFGGSWIVTWLRLIHGVFLLAVCVCICLAMTT